MQPGGESADLGLFLSRGSRDFMGCVSTKAVTEGLVWGPLGAVLGLLAPPSSAAPRGAQTEHRAPLGEPGEPGELASPSAGTECPWQVVAALLLGCDPAPVGPQCWDRELRHDGGDASVDLGPQLGTGGLENNREGFGELIRA